MFAVSHRNSGAFSHRDFDTNSRAFKPLEPSSAGFAFGGTYFHRLGRDAASILENRLAMKVGKRLEVLFMLSKTAVEFAPKRGLTQFDVQLPT